MPHMNFQEYLDQKNKLRTSGKVKKVADFEGSVDSKPPKEKKHKDAGGKGQDGEVKPYHAAGTPKDPNKGKNTDGFADKGDKKLKYEPNTDVPAKVGEGGKKTATWPKTKTQEWVDKTRGMSLAEFTKSVRAEALAGLDECACEGSPLNAIKETVAVCKCNKGYVSALVREMKRNGLFGKFFVEAMTHPEAFAVFAKLMERDETYARKLVKAMNEMVGPPLGDEEDEEDDLGPPEGEDDLGLDDMGGDDELGGDPMGDDLGVDDPMGDELGGGLDDEMGEPEPEMPPHDKIGKIGPPKKKRKKKHAADHLLSAMKDTPSMHGSLKHAMMMGMQ